MRKAITVHLERRCSFELRKKLIEYGFQFFTYKRVENEYEPIDEKYLSKKILRLDAPYELVGIYNGNDLSTYELEKLHQLLKTVHKDKSFIESTVHTTNG
jgi:hypothetical protein